MSETASAIIEFINPCPDPESVSSVLQQDPDEYTYTAQTPSMQFNLEPFEVEPSVCTITYSCKVIAGDRNDLCSITDGST